jgi:hypothetical protein
MEHPPKVKKLLVKLENKLSNMYYSEIKQYYITRGMREIPLELDEKCLKIIKNFVKKSHIFFQKEHSKLTDVPNEAIFSLKVKLNDTIENNNIQLNDNDPFKLKQLLEERKKRNKKTKSNLRERKLQNELRKKEALELEEQLKREEQRKRNESFENKLNDFVNEPILKGITRKNNKILSSRFNKMAKKTKTQQSIS